MRGKRKQRIDNSTSQMPINELTSNNTTFDQPSTSTRQVRKRGKLYNSSGLFNMNVTTPHGIKEKSPIELKPSVMVQSPVASNKHQNATSSSRVQISSTQSQFAQSAQRTQFEFGESSHVKDHVEQHSLGVSPFYLDLGDCDRVCQHCKAKFWYEERLKSSTKTNVQYHRCCGGGKVVLPMEQEPPEYIKVLYKNRHFLDNIRAYNQMFSMTSFGARIDESINDGRGPYVFKISGQIYHWIGTLCPTVGNPPRFLQLFIYDTQNEVTNRMRHFGGIESGSLSSEIVEGLISFLNEHNELVKLFRTASDKCKEKDVPEFKIRLYGVNGARQYDLPTSQTLGAIVFDGGRNSETDYDVIIELKDGIPQRINKLHPSYMALQFPLIFIYGETGFHAAMKLINLNGGESQKIKRLTMNMYYSYQLHDRFNLYGLLPRGGRLFQQYVVCAYCSIELSRIEYIRSKQNDIRNEYLSGLYDAITRGDHDGLDVGTRTILPASFTGGPRYMYSHYLDALAICRVHGNPQFFITFTCNAGWPEIRRYMEKYPELTPTDRADIVVRIFEMKVQQFVRLLKDSKPFGHVTAVLYTIEFQKRGLPHCHTLLWVTPTSKIATPEDVDQYISAELPDQALDPYGYRVVSETMMHGPCGLANSTAICMKDGVCSKNFPKKFNDKTYFDKDGYIHYQRRNTCIYTTKREVKLDNTYVVPYNRSLCLTFHAHINVEYCGWTMLIKYLFKYISKGCDRVVAHISRTDDDPSPSTGQTRIDVDEIKNYVDARYICPYEACWRIFNFDIHSREPAVQILAVHLENMQQIAFRANKLQDKVIVCPKNETADIINFEILSKLQRETTTYLSFDSATPFGNDGGETEMLYPVEYLNTLNFPGIPLHELELKIGAPIMLLRNINLVGGLCNDTRMIVTQLLTRVIEAQIITGMRVGEKVFIPRINLINKDPMLPFILRRKQFPVKLCYAMTINKSQGQSLKKIAVYLPEPIFGHGQLYVALSRATTPYGLKILIKKQENQPHNTTKNIVYKDFLLNIGNVND